MNGPRSHARPQFIAPGPALDAFLAEVSATEEVGPTESAPGMPEEFAERERALLAVQPRLYTMPAPLGGEVQIYTRRRAEGDNDGDNDVLFLVYDRAWDDLRDDLSDGMNRDELLESLRPPPLPSAPERD